MTTLIVALSGRALAQAAQRADADVIVADLFGDADTRSIAPWDRLPGTLEDGIDGAALLGWTSGLSEPIDGIVYGAGFEVNPDLLRTLARFASLIGNSPEVVAAIKDPLGFAELLRRLDLPHPEVAALPRPGTQWLRKRRGGSGGTHIEAAAGRSAPAGDAYYFQAMATGTPLSALFVANGRASRVIGLSAQWTAPTAARPYRYGGCAGPVHLAPRLAAEIESACGAITAATGLVGLNSLDMLVAGDAFTILEINPRPGATLDLFDDPRGPSLWDLHVSATRGELPVQALGDTSGARAAMVVYADQARYVPAAVTWESGIADIPLPESRISAGMPVCTVIATGPDAAAARGLAERRAAVLLSRLPPLLQQSA